MGIAFLFLVELFATSVILAVLPWRGRVRTRVLAAIPLGSLAVVAFIYLADWNAKYWSPLVWLVTFGPGSLIALVRLSLFRPHSRGRQPK